MRGSTALLFTAVALSACDYEAGATNIQWTPGKDDPSDKAATAPKSQKYWDEHGIERPDYAKTDSEIAQEKRANVGRPLSSSSSSMRTLVPLVLLAIVVSALAFWTRHRRGSRLGGGPGRFRSGHLSEEEARRARLAHFEDRKAL